MIYFIHCLLIFSCLFQYFFFIIRFCTYIFIIIVWFITPKECVKKDFWTSIDSLGYGIIKSCYTEYKIKNSINRTIKNKKTKLHKYKIGTYPKEADKLIEKDNREWHLKVK